MSHEINKWLKGVIQQGQYNKPTLSALARTFWQLKKPKGQNRLEFVQFGNEIHLHQKEEPK
jgi:hypothetical protein